jgi:hypothetical protein
MYSQYQYIDHEALGYNEEDIIPGISWHNGTHNRTGAIAMVYDPEAYQQWLDDEAEYEE